MKKHLKSFAVWLCIAVLLCSLTSCVKPSGPTPTVDNIPPSTSLSTPKPSPPAEQQPASDERYRMDISVDGMSVRVRQAVTYRNTSGKELGELKMHLYANAYRSYELVFEQSVLNDAYPNGFSQGGIDVLSVRSGAGDMAYTLSEDNCIMTVSLSSPLASGATVEFETDSIVTVPECRGRFGLYDGLMSLNGFFPKMCVYDDSGWDTTSYHPVGDPFYSNIGDYYVKLTVEGDAVPATTGNITNVSEGQRRTYSITAERVRDYAVAISREYKIERTKVGEVVVQSYYKGDNGSEALGYAVDMLELLTEKVGEYPYAQLSVAESGLLYGGMEFPGLILVNTEYYDNGNEAGLRKITAHETAHQYWYGVVGNDEVDEPWVDEALTDFCVQLLNIEEMGLEKANEHFKSNVINVYASYAEYFKNAGIPFNAASGGSVYEYADSTQYSLSVYYYGSIMYQSLYEIMGEDAFFEALRHYYGRYAFKHANGEDIIEVFEQVGGVKLKSVFNSYLSGTAVVAK